MTTAVAERRAATAVRAWPDRVLAAVPLLTVFAWLCLVYAWQAWSLGTPWLFTDELEHAQLARSVAETGETARRGTPHPMGSLYVLLTAPAWWIDDTRTAYDVAKYVGVVVMTAAVFPAYALARTIVSPAPALFAATATISIPAFMYSALLLQEPLAYTYATLCFFLVAKALAARTRWWIAAALAASAVAPFVRGELAVVPALFGLAVLGLLATSERARRWRAGWNGWDWAGAALLVAGAAIVVSELLSHRSEAWYNAWRYWEERMLDYGADAAGALTIGLGVLPVVAGLAVLARPRGEAPRAEVRAFTAVFVAAIVVFSLYTAVKAAYLSTNFATRVVERNMIYVAPLFFVGTALWLERRRVRWWALAAAAGAVLLLVWQTSLQLDYPYFEAPGFMIAALANRHLEWTQDTIEVVLLVVVAVAAALVALVAATARRARVSGALAATVAVVVLAWNLTGSIGAGAASVEFGDQLLANFPQPVTWVDDATGGEPAFFIVSQVNDATGIWMHEFWNRSIREVWSTDGTAPGPGPGLTPDLVSLKGNLYPDKGFRYALEERDIDLVGNVVDQKGTLRLVELDLPLRARSTTVGIYGDGWQPAFSAYSRYETPGNRAGTMLVTVSRAVGGGHLEANARVAIGPLEIGKDKQPSLVHPTFVRTVKVGGAKLERTVSLPTPRPPFRVEVTVDPLFVPADVDPRLSDRRQLGAQTTYRFVARR